MAKYTTGDWDEMTKAITSPPRRLLSEAGRPTASQPKGILTQMRDSGALRDRARRLVAKELDAAREKHASLLSAAATATPDQKAKLDIQILASTHRLRGLYDLDNKYKSEAE